MLAEQQDALTKEWEERLKNHQAYVAALHKEHINAIKALRDQIAELRADSRKLNADNAVLTNLLQVPSYVLLDTPSSSIQQKPPV